MKIRKAQAQEVRAIHKEKGYIKPQDVVAKARDENSALHDYFDWDNDSAAEKYRVYRARHLLKSFRFEIEGVTGREYFNAKVTIEDKRVQAYFPTIEIVKNDELNESVIREALKKIRGIQREYGFLKEVKEIINKDKLSELEDSYAI